MTGFAAGCGRDPVASPETADSLTLYSIDGRDFEPGKAPKSEETFHGYPVLGKVEVKEAAKRKEILSALKDGIAHSDEKMMAKCFWPRHALRASEKGKTVDYVICFECYQLKIHSDGKVKTEPTTREPQSVLSKHLKDAGVPLAPGTVE
jgi:hypothetical protein